MEENKRTTNSSRKSLNKAGKKEKQAKKEEKENTKKKLEAERLGDLETTMLMKNECGGKAFWRRDPDTATQLRRMEKKHKKANTPGIGYYGMPRLVSKQDDNNKATRCHHQSMCCRTRKGQEKRS